MIYRSAVVAPGVPLVELIDVSKRFSMQNTGQRSIQESLIRRFQRRKKAEDDGFWPLRDISFAVSRGESLGFIGSNGSGKSTLLKLITGILEPTRGDVAVRGRVSSLLELGAGFHPDLTGRENIYLNGAIFGLSTREMKRRLDSIVDFAELGDFIDAPIKHYSSGMYVRLGFAVAIHSDPDLLLVDEVLAVGDTNFQHKCMASIQKFRKDGGTLLLVSHDLTTIQSICQQAIWLDHGRIRSQGYPTDVVMAYLNDVARHEDAKSRNKPLEALKRGMRWGSGKIEITGVDLCDAHGEVSSIFVEGGPLEICLHFAAAERVETPVFGIAIHSESGIHVCGPNTKFGQLYIPYVEGEGTVVYRIPELPLLEGGYILSVAVVDHGDTEMFDYHDRAYPFRVYPGRSGEHYGLLTLGGQWGFETPLSAEQVAFDPEQELAIS